MTVTSKLFDAPGRDTVAARKQRGKAARQAVPRSMHADWSPPTGRDPVATITSQDEGRIMSLVPVRHQRMSQSAFAFYRGGAKIMAHDLASTPVSGFDAQLCGDAHISNFGFFGSPERQLLFDVNDFDETLPGPWEWDVKRLAASIVIAGRHRGLEEDDIVASTRHAVELYRRGMRGFAEEGILEGWYASLSVDEVSDVFRKALGKKASKTVDKLGSKARKKDSAQVLGKLGVETEGAYRIAADPPFLIPFRHLVASGLIDPDSALLNIERNLEEFRFSLASNRRALVDRFTPIDFALKVVGVGSVGTACFVLLLEGRDRDDPLFLQLKEASTSVLEDILPPSDFNHSGERVVAGQRLMQSASDIFLGWSTGNTGRAFYWRQLKDMKGSVDLDEITPEGLRVYAGICGWTLARAHTRSGDPIAIASYLGSGKAFDRAIAEFGSLYADQNEEDYRAYMAAIAAGDIEVADEPS